MYFVAFLMATLMITGQDCTCGCDAKCGRGETG